MNSSLQKNTDLMQFFIIKPRHPGRLKKLSGWKKPSVGALPGHMRQNATTVTWSGRLRIYYRVTVTQERPRVQQSASKFRNLLLQAKDRTWANCALALSVSGTSWSRLCLDGPRVHLSAIKGHFWLHAMYACTE